MKIRRFAFALGLLPLAMYAYACSSDSSSGGGDNDAGPDGSTSNDSGSGTDTGSTDSGTNDSGDASDGAVPPVCIGNPLTADGGTSDGGVALDAGLLTQIVNEPLATGQGATFVDGPQFIDYNGGSLVFSELYSSPPTVVRVSPDGGARATIRSSTQTINELFIGNAVKNGVVLSTLAVKPGATLAAGIYETEPDAGDAGFISVGANSTNPNDLVVGPKGDIYFTDPQFQSAGTTGAYRIQPDGGVTTINAPLDRVNGIALSPDASKLYVTITDLKRVLSFAVSADGSITGSPTATSTIVVNATIDAPDGMTVDVGGNLWVAEANATGAVQSGRVEVFSPTGTKLGELPFPTQRPTGVAFGGADNKTLFVTTETGVWVYASRCAGLR